MSLIEVEDLEHIYQLDSPKPQRALCGINLSVDDGEYLAVVGLNGSGKSTFAFHLNGLLTPTRGRVRVAGLDTRDKRSLAAIRQTVAMVFQKPEDQIVALTIEEDVAFGPENQRLAREEIRARVGRALARVRLAGLELRSPHELSAGQKQRLAIAGALALEPRVIVFDEATSMLDPAGRREVLELMLDLNRRGTTIIHITHRMEEAALAGRMVMLESGRVAADGSPGEVFASAAAEALGRPAALEMARALSIRGGIDLGSPIEYAELADRLLSHLPRGGSVVPRREGPRRPRTPLIRVDGVSHSYTRSEASAEASESHSLRRVSLEIGRGEVVAVIGPTGSGKSTLLQHLNGLFFPQSGSVEIDGVMVKPSEPSLPGLRRRVGLVFQRPEEQIFAQYVGDEIAYGPRLAGIAGKELTERVRRAMELVGLPFTEFKDRLSFGLSGGEQRKVALAGILSLEPAALLLDEPTVGLDPPSRRQILDLLRRLRGEGTTIVLSTHDMDVAASLADRIVVLSQGRILFGGTPASVFARGDELRGVGLDLPGSIELLLRLREAGIELSIDFPTTVDAVVTELLSLAGLETTAVKEGD